MYHVDRRECLRAPELKPLIVFYILIHLYIIYLSFINSWVLWNKCIRCMVMLYMSPHMLLLWCGIRELGLQPNAYVLLEV